ncbi:hypothetical protein SGLAM104S_02981 [Streptomyces glaucescens]
MAESTARGSLSACRSSAITGTLSGPSTSGRTVSEFQPGKPNRIGRAAHFAVALLWVMTMSTGSHRYFSYR